MSYFDGSNSNDNSSDDEDVDENENKSHVEEDEEDEEIEGGGGEIDDDEMIIEDGDDTEYVDEDEEQKGDEEDEDEDDDEDDVEEGDDTEYVDEDKEQYEDEDEDEEGENKQKKSKKVPTKNVYKKPTDYINDEDEDEDNDDDGEQYLQKFDHTINENYVMNYHPETVLHNYDEIAAMTKVTRNPNGIIIDKLHRTIPYLTKYEKARILGQRAKQINAGAYPLVKVPENVIDGLIIAELELKQKSIPFIIRRPLPNGGSEYWKVKDLEDISF